MTYKTPLGRVRGLGSAKGGTHHFWVQRVSAVALIPLTVWFSVTVIGHAGADHAAVVAWLRDPTSAVLMIAFVAAVFYHGQLGVQVVIEDYVHAEGLKIGAIIAVKMLAALLALAGILAVLRIAIGS